METFISQLRTVAQWSSFVESGVWRTNRVAVRLLAEQFKSFPSSSSTTNANTLVQDEFWAYFKSLNDSDANILGNNADEPLTKKFKRSDDNYLCGTCQATFNNRESLRLHRISKHSVGDPNLQCPHCQYKTLRKCRMGEHILKRHSVKDAEKGKTIGIETVGAMPQSKNTKSNGLELATQPNWITCDECKRVCSVGSDYDKHMLKHQTATTSVKLDFSCPTCGEKFTRQANLNIHIDRKHSKQQHLVLVNSTEVEEDLFACLLCPAKYNTDFLLKLHVERSHEKPIPTEANMTENMDDLWIQTEPARSTFNKRFGLLEEAINVKVSDKGMTLARKGMTIEVLENVLRTLFEPYKDRRACISFTADSKSLDRPIVTPFVMTKDFDTTNVINCIERVLQSNKDFGLEEQISLCVKSIAFPEGSGKCKPKFFSTALEFVRRKRSTWDPRNSDNRCFSYCLAAFVLSLEDKKYKNSYWWQNGVFGSDVVKTKAARIREVSGIPDDQSCGLTEWQQVQDKFLAARNVQLVIFSRNDFDAIVFGDNTVSRDIRKLYLVLADNHFLWVLKPNAYLKPNKYCEECGRLHNGRHSCTKTCSQCRSVGCALDPEQNRLYCQACRRTMTNAVCFRNHRSNGTCENVRLCLKCLKLINGGKTHDHCGERLCRNCETWVRYDSTTGTPHLCHIAKPKASKTLTVDAIMVPKSFSYIFYDYETYVERSTGRHVPMLVVAQHVCHQCIDTADIYQDCPTFGRRQLVFEKPDGCESFAHFLFFDPRNRDAKVFAHNGSRYDCYFLLNWLVQRGHKPQSLINVGNKILQLKGGDTNVELKDTYMFFATRLSSLPDMFGMKNLAKGDFPHKFNQPENWSYSGRLPALENYYTSTFKTVEERLEFEQWHTANADEQFEFMPECVKYCIRDVDILRLACMEFRKVSVELTGIDPLSKAITAANFCSKVFRKNYVNEGEIGILPRGGYTPASKQQSLIAIKYLTWLEKSLNVKINHAGNSQQEPRAGHYFVDGIYANDHKHIVQVHGCFWHGCPDCFPHSSKSFNKVRNCSMRSCYEATMRVTRDLIALDFTVDTVWEHEIKQMLHGNCEMREFFDDSSKWFDYDVRIGEREGLFGGRTNAAVLLRELTDDEISAGHKICYYDFCSLYPTVQKRFMYPTGHPEVMRSADLPQGKDFTLDFVKANVFGVVKAKVMAPKNLLFPVLPAKIRGKLCFALCRICAEENNREIDAINNQVCGHDDSERSFVGTWMSPEVEVALENGYIFQRVYEIWNYTTRAHLFSGYVNNFLTVKAEASGWPEHPCKSELCSTKNNSCDECEHCLAARKEFVREYKEAEDITLDPAKISYNAGKRSMAKIWLNSLWGKLTENPEKSTTQYLQNAADLRKLLLDDMVEIKNLQMASSTICVVTTTQPDDRDLKPFYAPVVGSFVTTYGRLELYRVLKLKAESVLYYDTDSVIFVQAPDSPVLPTGNKLGDLTDELKGDFIVKFCSSGPKSYSYVTSKGHVETKIKGISIRNEVRDFLDFETVKAVTLARLDNIPVDTDDDLLSQLYTKVSNEKVRSALLEKHKVGCYSVAVPDGQMVKTRFQATIVSNDERVKFYRLVYDKRVVLPNYRTIPFGCINC